MASYSLGDDYIVGSKLYPHQLLNQCKTRLAVLARAVYKKPKNINLEERPTGIPLHGRFIH
jgi:hypothetical protein